MTETNANGVPIPRALHTPTVAEQFRSIKHTQDWPAEPPPDPGYLTADQLADPLRSIAVLLRSLTCEQMWRMTGDEGMRKPELEKVFIEWSKAYMEDRPMADVTQGRRA